MAVRVLKLRAATQRKTRPYFSRRRQARTKSDCTARRWNGRLASGWRTLTVESAVRQNGAGLYVKGEYSEAFGQHWRVILTGIVIAGKEDDVPGQYHRPEFLRFDDALAQLLVPGS